jgi:hypothetical protein
MSIELANFDRRDHMSEIEYTYYGVLIGDRTADRPAGVIRVWTAPDGRQMEETFMSSLRWEKSYQLSPMTRPDYSEIVAIDESAVERYIERVTKKHSDGA